MNPLRASRPWTGPEYRYPRLMKAGWDLAKVINQHPPALLGGDNAFALPPSRKCVESVVLVQLLRDGAVQ